MPSVDDHSASEQDQSSSNSALLRTLDDLHQQMRKGDCAQLPGIPQLHASYRQSAENLNAYLCLRRHDMRPVQLQLAELGLSSLAGCEAYCLNAVENVITALRSLSGETRLAASSTAPGPASGRELLRVHTEALLGSAPDHRSVRIMVTLPDEAADDAGLVHELIAQGMNCARINCAHGDADSWLRMISHVRNAAEALGCTCKVMMDLAGPKLRTGAIEAEAPVLKIKPERNRFGQVTKSARLWLAKNAAEVPTAVLDSGLPWVEVSAKRPANLHAGDILKLRDARHSKRVLRVVQCTTEGCWAELDKTAYLAPGLMIKTSGRRNKKRSGKAAKFKITAIPQQQPFIELRAGESLMLHRSGIGRHARHDAEGRLTEPASVVCDVAELYRDARIGQPIWFDDGKIGGRIEAVDDERLEIEIEHIAHASGQAKLRSAKGINLPETDLQLAALTEEDVQALEFAVAHADAIELSFANTVEDVQAIAAHLQRLRAEHMGVVLKIETRKGFANLPSMLLTGMQFERFGIMIARGDLAVENGFERLAEVQEEMLCLCEAAHVPVVWATQVLETLAKKGAPSRAEITDAAMGVRAECVMLNKGPHILDAIRTLDDLLKRMQGHHIKNRGMMRRLSVAQDASTTAPASYQ